MFLFVANSLFHRQFFRYLVKQPQNLLLLFMSHVEIG
jgi:hypothetical protein